MQKSNIYTSRDKRKVNPDWFTGKVYMRDISTKIKSREQNVYHVYFANGSKTKLHKHDGSQILIATAGTGSLEIFRRSGTSKENFKIKKIGKISLHKGDTVYIPAGVLHAHGSTSKRQTFSHIAINIFAKKNNEYKTSWYESDFKSKATRLIK